MSQKNSKFDEFESLFRSVVRPHLEVDPLPLERLLVVIDAVGDQAKHHGLTGVAASMADRFKVEVLLFCPVEDESVRSTAEEKTEEIAAKITASGNSSRSEVAVGHLSELILEKIGDFKPDFILLPSLFSEKDAGLEGYSLGGTVDKVLSKTGVPILLIEGDIAEPEKLWEHILLFVEEVPTAEPCIAATRTLAAKNAAAQMLHVIDSHMLSTVKRAFEVATELDTDNAVAALEKGLRRDIVHYLEGAKELLDRTGHNSSFTVRLGDPVEVTRDIIQEEKPRLVVCNSVSPDQRLVDSVAYNLAAYLREVPLLLV